MVIKTHKKILYSFTLVVAFLLSFFAVKPAQAAENCVFYNGSIYCETNYSQKYCSGDYLLWNNNNQICWQKKSVSSVGCVNMNGTLWCKNTSYKNPVRCEEYGRTWSNNMCWEKRSITNPDQPALDDCKGLRDAGRTALYEICMNKGYDSEKGVDCANSGGELSSSYVFCMSQEGSYDSKKQVIGRKPSNSTISNWINPSGGSGDSMSDGYDGVNDYDGSDAAKDQSPPREGSETPIPDTSANTEIPDPIYGTPASFDGRTGGECMGFLGLVSWDCNVQISDQSSLEVGISHIAANILTDITIIAAYLVLGYTIYGGYKYVFSAGDPSKATEGKKTLTRAFIGLAVVMSAQLIMSTIRFALLQSGQMTGCATQECINPNSVIFNAIQWTIGVSGVVAVIFIVYGGIMYVTSSGNPENLQKAKKVITYALIGLAIVALSEIITAFASNIIREASNPESSYIINNEKSIAKETNEKNNT